MIFSELTTAAAWREYGIDPVVENIRKVIGSFPIDNGDTIAGIAMGVPCFGESGEGDKALLQAFEKTFSGIPVYLTNDVEVGWAGSLSLAPGINVVAGTGSIAFGKDESGETARCGGWSEFFGDEGSCYWIGRKVLQLFSKQSDGRDKKDELYSVVCKELEIKNDFGIIDLVHNDYIVSRDKVAALQLLARDAALAGSSSAGNLYIEAAGELCNMVTAIRDRLQFEKQPFSVSYSGGLFKAGELILPHFYKCVTEAGGTPVTPKYEPVYGAVLLAFEQNCPDKIQGLKKRLDEL